MARSKGSSTARTPPATKTIVDQLRQAIEDSGLSAYALAKDAEVDPGQISRFVAGERDLRLETAGRLAQALGLRLIEGARRKPVRGRRS